MIVVLTAYHPSRRKKVLHTVKCPPFWRFVIVSWLADHDSFGCWTSEDRSTYTEGKAFLPGESAAERKCNIDTFAVESSLERVEMLQRKWEEANTILRERSFDAKLMNWQDYNKHKRTSSIENEAGILPDPAEDVTVENRMRFAKFAKSILETGRFVFMFASLQSFKGQKCLIQDHNFKAMPFPYVVLYRKASFQRKKGWTSHSISLTSPVLPRVWGSTRQDSHLNSRMPVSPYKKKQRPYMLHLWTYSAVL